MSKKLSIVFMGTPDFAVGILRAILENDFEVKAVVTATDKPAGRGQKISESAVKKFALEKNLTILQPEKLKDESFIETLKNINADIFVVVAFRMLPKIVFEMPVKGTINLHASLLPNYRGAAPINWAIMNGEVKTGVTTFFIEEKIDTGKIIEREAIKITDDMTAGELHDHLMNLGAQLMVKTLVLIEKGEEKPKSQTELITGSEKDAPKIFKEDCQIIWGKLAIDVHNQIRGLSPYPGSWCLIENPHNGEKKNFKIFKTEKTTIAVKEHKIIIQNKKELLFPCKDYYIRIIELQPEGKKRLNANNFMVGNSIDGYKLI